MYAEIAFPISSYQTFTYRVPDELKDAIRVGIRVKAPLKRRNAQGIVVRRTKQPAYKGKILPISEVVDPRPVMDSVLWELLQWMSRYYLTPLGQVARAALPATFTESYEPPKEYWIQAAGTISSQEKETLIQKAPVQAAILDKLTDEPSGMAVKELASISKSALNACRALEKKGFAALRRVPRIPDRITDTELPVSTPDIVHTREQQKAIQSLTRGLNSHKFKGYLLHGVTGSGKTEIYVEMTRRCLAQNRTALIMVPEIALASQIAGRFRAEFGQQAALWHSGLKPAVRAWTWKRICQGVYTVIIGARSAVFTPVKNPGLIVIDEEQEHAYKQESPAPRYHAREVALVRGRESGAVVVLASATPSLESYYNQIHNKLHYLTLTERATGAKFPKVTMVDMNTEKDETGKTGQILSGTMIRAIEHRLEKGEQAILLQNRRGFAPILKCRDCGHVMECPHCQVTLVYHKVGERLECHICGYTQTQIPEVCPSCAGPSLYLQGTGTQKIEAFIQETFPQARLTRLDLDTSRKQGYLVRSLSAFSRGEIDILLGTQMIAKGLDFEKATLVGVINADLGLYLPDFRAGERVFQLLYQAAGRSGRGSLAGEVVVQSYSPDNPAVHHATHLDLKMYYNQLLAERKTLSYPPFSWLARLELTGVDALRLQQQGETLRKHLPRARFVESLGPVECYRNKVRDRYRIQFVFKSKKEKDPNAGYLHRYLNSVRDFIQKQKQQFPGTRFIFDVDPVSLL